MTPSPQDEQALYFRMRFYTNADDYRPVIFPPPGPYWCSGYAFNGDDDYAVVVAYVKHKEQVTEFWPDAKDVEESGEPQPRPIRFSGRFPKPNWWEEK
jgi:hypothetical protein